MTYYPNSVFSSIPKVDGVNVVMALDVNELDSEVNAIETDLLGGWTDYSTLSTITGWASFTAKQLSYRKVGRLVFVVFLLQGTSNNTLTSFTLPFTPLGVLPDTITLAVPARDGGAVISTAICSVTNGNATASLYKDLTGTAWTATGIKDVRGAFFYPAL